ncbi:hypothetical protein M406DRAFT_75795 [Cryphonectria parasitica EP155]|uniref:CENP-V/GFA domain-containing protein n=1 Tax=Cryphonectria parasitica (strain ATCC 38755 / EP155) TaxID=660469 RepID=A0A9P4YA61_CRYP1|nr:uncharacterized protein M406DRAFT_75795 [Cryphonectria parasitica EP155]KAF3769313.1 hypothetical protein M406DRAFT_75795 [Cryphonectria parasitica EP155]
MTSTTTTTTTTGQCLCGRVKVTVTGKPLSSFPTLTCHCNSCKKRSGGVASYAFLVPKQHVQFSPAPNEAPTDDNTGSAAAVGVHKVYVDRNTGSGQPMQRTMCGACGSPVCIIEAADADVRCLQFGLFAGSEGVDLSATRPGLELFASRRVAWIPEIGEEVREAA